MHSQSFSKVILVKLSKFLYIQTEDGKRFQCKNTDCKGNTIFSNITIENVSYTSRTGIKNIRRKKSDVFVFGRCIKCNQLYCFGY